MHTGLSTSGEAKPDIHSIIRTTPPEAETKTTSDLKALIVDDPSSVSVKDA